MRQQLWLVLVFLMLCCSYSVAQTPHPILRHYGTTDGLPSSEVYDILQDREGYIWVSTDNGVCRFNGYQFESLTSEQGLTDPVVFYLFEDHRGWIWMYSFKDQVFIYRNGRVDQFEHTDLLKSFRVTDDPGGLIWMLVDEAGNFFAAVAGSGIIRIDPAGGCTDLTADIPRGYQIWTHQGRHFYSIKDKITDIGAPEFDPIYQASVGKQTLTILRPDGSRIIRTKPYRRYPEINTVFFHKNNPSHPALPQILMQYDDRLETIDVRTGETLQHIPYPRGTIVSWLHSKQHNLLFFGHDYANRGLNIYDQTNYTQNLDLLRTPQLKILEDNTITHLLEDKQGGLWIGTLEDGIYYIPDPTILLSYFNDSRLALPRSITSGAQDSMLVRTQDHRVYVINSKREVTEIPQKMHFGNGYQLLYDTSRQQILASGLLKFWSPEQNRWLFVLREGIAPEKQSINDHNQALILRQSSIAPHQFWLLDMTNFYQVNFGTSPPERGINISLSPRQRLFSLLETQDGRVYIGGMEGLYQLQEDGSSQQIVHHQALQNRIEDLVEMPDGTIVIGTKGGGILLWGQDTTIQITKAQGLTSSSIEKLHLDQLGQIWVGTNSGLNRILLDQQTKDYTISSMTYADGLPSNEITDIHSRGSELWVATVEGLLTIPIDKTLSNNPVTPVIESLQVNGYEQAPGYLNALKWFEDNIRIAVTSLDFPQAGQVTYRYRFTKDTKWQVTQSPLIEVARLSPGNYNFEIQAKGRNGTWSPAVGFPLHLQNPFWTSLWFWLGMLGIVFMLIAIYYYRELRRQARQQAQDQQLLQLETQLNDLRQQAYRAQMNPHFVYNCLTAIQSYMLSNKSDQLTASDYLAKFAMLTRQALEASRKKSVSLYSDIKMLENYIQLEQFRFSQSFTYEIEVAADVATHEISLPALLVQPYVENAVLHGLSGLDYPGYLHIRYWMEGEYLNIRIKDNGVGINTHREQQSTLKHKKGHQSAGMDIARKRIQSTYRDERVGQVVVDEHHCEGQVCGTNVHVQLPVNS